MQAESPPSDPNETPAEHQPAPEELSKPESESQPEEKSPESDHENKTPQQVSSGGTGGVHASPEAPPPPAVAEAIADANEENIPVESGVADLVAEQIINEPEYPVQTNAAQQFQQPGPEDLKLTTHRIFPFTKVKACQRAHLEVEPSDRPLLQQSKHMTREQMWAAIETKRHGELKKQGVTL